MKKPKKPGFFERKKPGKKPVPIHIDYSYSYPPQEKQGFIQRNGSRLVVYKLRCKSYSGTGTGSVVQNDTHIRTIRKK